MTVKQVDKQVVGRLSKKESKKNAVYEIVVSGTRLRIRTKNIMRTLIKLANKGLDAYVQWDPGWILVRPEAVEELIKEGKAVVPFMLEPPTFRGVKAYQYIKVYKEDLENP
jgi:hypothetical protein